MSRDFYRPREKLLHSGVTALKNSELLQVIINSGNSATNVEEIAAKVNDILSPTIIPTIADLLSIKGISYSKACKLISALELGRRHHDSNNRLKLNKTENLLLCVSEIRARQREHLVLLTVDGSYHLIRKRVVSIGTLNSTLIHPREVFHYAVSDRAAAIYLVHNHPSGNCAPSESDLRVTEKIATAGNLLGIELLDHLIITKHQHISCL